MTWYEFIWSHEPCENVDHIADAGISQDDFEYAFTHYADEQISRSSGRPIRFGYTEDGRFIACVFEWVEQDVSVAPITAYEID